MDSKERKNIGWIIMVILIIAVYFFGKNSNSPTASVQNTTEKNVPARTSPMSSDEVFANKTKCEGYMDTLKKQATSNSFSLEMDIIYKVFYSQSLNTCLSEEYNLYPAHQSIAEGEVLLINDVLTGGNVWTSQTYTPELKYWDAETALDQQAMRYQ